jgi:transposase
VIAELKSVVVELRAVVETLQRRLGRNSQNSSKPPSSDPPGAPPAPKRKRSGRKPGGQPGHKGSRRELLPPEKVDRFEDFWPSACGACEGDLPGERWRRDVGEPMRHQVTEVPPVTPTTTEYRLHCQRCPGCGATTTAKLPEGVTASAFGPRVTALVAILTGGYRLSKRTAVSVMKDLFGVEMSLGSVTACEQAVSETMAEPVAEAHEFVKRQDVVHADETGWRETRARAWLWVAATAAVTVFRICAQRGKEAAKALLGDFRGTLVTDRWDAYLWYGGLRQICWAHLLRDFRDMSERKGAAGRIGRELERNAKAMFKAWHRVRDGTLTRRGFRQKMAPVRLEFERLLKLGHRGGTPIAGSCGEMLALFGSFFTFVDHEGIEPTNNFAERQIRHAVIWRKTSFGTHSPAGSRFVERLLTVRATLRQQGRNLVEYVVQAQQAALRGDGIPSLLPSATVVAQAAA